MTYSGVVVASGGLDSTTLVYDLYDRGDQLHLLSFDYGQKHKKELHYIKMTAQRLGLRHDVIDLSGITRLISNSALTSETDVPEGHYAEENMKQTVVPNRNMIMLSIAAAVAVNEKADYIATAVHSGDHFIYPDCRPEFVRAMNLAIGNGNEGFDNFKRVPATYWGLGKWWTDAIHAPYLHWTKADIAYRAIELGVPLHLTWSCYKGGEKHCGRCGTCVERLEAIHVASQRWIAENQLEGAIIDALTDKPVIPNYDHTEYEDTEFWKTATGGGNK